MSPLSDGQVHEALGGQASTAGISVFSAHLTCGRQRCWYPVLTVLGPWNFAAVLTVLRNRAYLGEVFFRDTYHPAPHPPLVDADVFQSAQQILIARGEDHAKRASNGSDYLLAGLITCTRCGARFVGGAAKGNRYRYRYYTCFTRHRYGTGSCDAERLPADQLDQAVLDSLLHTYAQSDLLQRALTAGQARAGEQQHRVREELAVIDAELRKTEEAIERYLLAFEAGTLPEATCGQRVQTLAEKTAGLRDRRTELTATLDATAHEGPTEAELDALRSKIRDVVTGGDTGAQKQLLYSLVHDIQAASRGDIHPTFRIPASVTVPEPKVRKLTGSVRSAGFEPATS